MLLPLKNERQDIATSGKGQDYVGAPEYVQKIATPGIGQVYVGAPEKGEDIAAPEKDEDPVSFMYVCRFR